MSWVATAYVKKLRVAPNGELLTRGEKLLCFVLADYFHDEKQYAWASLSHLAQESLHTRRGVMLAVNGLKRKGVLSVFRPSNARTNHYRFPELESPGSCRLGEVSSLDLGSPIPPTREATSPVVGKSVPQPREASSPDLGKSVPPIFPRDLSTDLSKDNGVEQLPDLARNLWLCAEELLEYLNKKASRSFLSRKPNKKPTASLQSIHGLLQQGYTAEQIRQVIDDRVQRWRDDVKMREYLRPETLFRTSKFEQYLGTVGEVRVSGPKAFQQVPRVVTASTECPPEVAAALSKILGREAFSFSADHEVAV